MHTSLREDLQISGWHSSIMTTYSVDPAFYDKCVERLLQRAGCTNNILIADSRMLATALETMPDAFGRAGRRYAVVPAEVRGCFHPKLHLRLGAHKARLVVGSANATAAGWCRNLEVLAALDWKAGGDDGVGSLIRKAYDYLMHWLPASASEALRYKCGLHLTESRWLADHEASTEAVVLPDRTAIDLLCERGGDSPSIHEQFVARVGSRAKRLIVVSPYWDVKLHALRNLRKAFGDCETSIVLDEHRNEFPSAALTAREKDVAFYQLGDASTRKRFPHAKIILVETATADHLLAGSANCSDNALGSTSARATNAEASLYRRLPKGSARQILDIRLDRRIPRSRLAAAPRPAAPEPGKSGFHPGALELVGTTIHWYPAPGLEVEGASLKIGPNTLPVTTSGNGGTAKLAAQRPTRIVARVALASGRLSSPVLVLEDAPLRKAGPVRIDRRLSETFGRMRDGFADIVDLALHVNAIFAQEPRPIREPGVGGQKRKRTAAFKGKDYATAAAFRRAVALAPATGTSAKTLTGDAGLLQILGIMQRGIAAIPPADVEEDPELDDDRALIAGEREDGEEKRRAAGQDADEEEDQEDEEEEPDLEPLPLNERVFRQDEFEQRRKQVIKSLERFQETLEELIADPTQVSANVATQTAFVIQLMMFSCTFEHKRENLGADTLMHVFIQDSRIREHSLAYWLMRMMDAVWIGGDGDPIARHIHVSEHHASLPDDLFEWVVDSRWAILRAWLASAGATGILARKLPDTAKSVYAATRKFGPIDAQAEIAKIRDLDARFGFSSQSTEEVLRQHARM